MSEEIISLPNDTSFMATCTTYGSRTSDSALVLVEKTEMICVCRNLNSLEN